MDYLSAGLLGGALAASAGGVFLHGWINRRRATRQLRARPELDPTGFGRTYFGESERRARLAAQVRRVLAKHVPYGLEGLGPNDAFVQDLRMDELDSVSTVEFVVALEERFGITISDKDARSILTVRQLVDYLDARVPEDRIGVGSERAGEQADEQDASDL